MFILFVLLFNMKHILLHQITIHWWTKFEEISTCYETILGDNWGVNSWANGLYIKNKHISCILFFCIDTKNKITNQKYLKWYKNRIVPSYSIICLNPSFSSNVNTHWDLHLSNLHICIKDKISKKKTKNKSLFKVFSKVFLHILNVDMHFVF